MTAAELALRSNPFAMAEVEASLRGAGPHPRQDHPRQRHRKYLSELTPRAAKVTPTAETVVIDIRTYVRYGAHNCQGSSMAPSDVDLGSPLGDRTLIDANGDVVLDAKYRFPQLTVPQAA